MATIGQALTDAGFSMTEIVRMHYYLADAAFAERVFPVVGALLAEIRPAATMIVSELIRPEMKIEIEATALKL